MTVDERARKLAGMARGFHDGCLRLKDCAEHGDECGWCHLAATAIREAVKDERAAAWKAGQERMLVRAEEFIKQMGGSDYDLNNRLPIEPLPEPAAKGEGG